MENTIELPKITQQNTPSVLQDETFTTNKNIKREVSKEELVRQNSFEATQKEETRLKNIENATVGDKYFGMTHLFDTSLFGEIIDYWKLDRGLWRTEDKEFKNNFSEDIENTILETYALPEESRSVIQEAKNWEHLYDLAYKEKLQKDAQKNAMNIYTDSENLAYGIAVSIGTDPTVLFTGGAGLFVRTGANIARANALKNATTVDAATLRPVTDLNKLAEAESSLLVWQGAKETLAKTSVATNLSYGAMVAGIDDDTSLVEAMIIHGITSAIDYKVINAVKTNGYSPSVFGVSMRDTNTMYAKSDLTSNAAIKLLPEKIDIETKPLSVRQSTVPEFVGTSRYIQQDTLPLLPYLNRTDGKLNKLEINALKNDIEARLKLNKSSGFLPLIKSAEKISKEISRAAAKIKAKDDEIFKKAKSLRIVNQEIDDIFDLAKDIEMSIADTKKALEVISKTGKGADNIAADILNVYRAIYKQGYISKSAMQQLEYSYKAGKGKNFKTPKLEAVQKKGKDGKTYTHLKINGKTVKVLGASALVIGGSTLSADEFGVTDVTSNAGTLVLIGIAGAFLGVPAYQAIKTSGLKNTFQSAVKFATKAKALDDTRDIRSKIGETINKSRTSLFETTQPLLTNTKGHLNQFVKKLYWNPLEPEATTLEISKSRYAKRYESLEREHVPIFNEWLKSQGKGRTDSVMSMFKDQSLRVEFDTKVFEYMTMGKHSDDIFVVKSAKLHDEYNQQFAKAMKESGVNGAEDMFKVTDNLMYVPRMNRGRDFANNIVGITEKGKEDLIIAFSKMLTKSENPIKDAEDYIENMLTFDRAQQARTFSKDERLKLTNEMKARGVSDDMIEEIIDSMSSKFGRTQARIHMDYANFKPVEIEFSDGVRQVALKDLFETNISTISSRFFNQAGGHIALALNDFKSVDDAMSILNDAKKLGEVDADTFEIIKNDIMALVGTPSIDYSVKANVVARDIANIAVAKMMIMSTISLTSEGIMYFSNVLKGAGVFKGMQKLGKDIISGFGKDSFIASSIPFGKDGLSFAQQRFGGSYGQHTVFDEFTNPNSIENSFSKYSQMARDFTLHTLPFSKASDYIARLNFQDVLNRTYHHLSGGKPFEEYEKLAYPMSSKLENYLKRNLSLNDKGNVKFFNYQEAPIDIQDELYNYLWNTMAKRQNQATMGTTGAWTRQTALGVAIMPMLKYPMSAWVNIGGFSGRGMLKGDPYAFAQTALWFQAGMLQAVIRNELSGREYDENDLIIAGILNSPMYGGLSTVTGVLSSPTSSMAGEIGDLLDIYSYSK